MAVRGRDVGGDGGRAGANDRRSPRRQARTDCREAFTTPGAGRLGRSPHLLHYSGAARAAGWSWDVVHCWEEPYVAAGAQVAQPRRPPASFRDVSEPRQALSAPVRLRTRVMRRADGWIAFGQTVHDAPRREAPLRGKPSRVIPPGVDVERFRPDAARAAYALGWVDRRRAGGRFPRPVRAGKGAPRPDAALEPPVSPGARCSSAADRWKPICGVRRRASRPRACHRVAHDEVPAYLNAMDLLCAPSRTTPRWREQFGRMLIEAMACGVPVVASHSGEIPHVVGDAGVIVDEADVARWTEAIERLLATIRDLRRDLAPRPRARAREVRLAGRRPRAPGVLRRVVRADAPLARRAPRRLPRRGMAEHGSRRRHAPRSAAARARRR